MGQENQDYIVCGFACKEWVESPELGSEVKWKSYSLRDRG